MVIITYLIFLINPFFSLITIILGLIKDRKNNVHYSLLLAGVFACLAYWVTPFTEIDLTRYFDQLFSIQNLSWSQFSQSYFIMDYLYVKNIIFYTISKTGDFHLLPFFVIWVSYFIMLYMLTDYANRSNVKSKDIILAVLFLICVMPFISLVSNVRNILAFSILTLGIYREFVQNKKNIITYIFYILPLFIHISSIVLIGIRVLAKVSSNKKTVNAIFTICFIAIIIVIFNSKNLVAGIPYVGVYMSSFIDQAMNYIDQTTSNEYANFLQQSVFSKIQKYFFIGTTIFILILGFFMKSFKSISFYMSNYYRYIIYLVIACAPFILTVYFRFTMVVLMLAFLVIFQVSKIKSFEWRIVTYLCLMAIMIFGLLQQLYFFNQLASISDMFYNTIPRSFFNMFSR